MHNMCLQLQLNVKTELRSQNFKNQKVKKDILFSPKIVGSLNEQTNNLTIIY